MCPTRSQPHIAILLATFQGAQFLEPQLASLAAQSHGNWSLIVSDDGSTDGTLGIVTAFAASRPDGQVRLVAGPQAGATRNFLHLLGITPENSIAAFCDQDDVWFDTKLERAVSALAPVAGPAHYAARTLICDEQLQVLTESRRFVRPFGFRNALIQACMAGNTSVFNPQAVALLKQGLEPARAAGIESHDWWAYQLMAGAGATLIHDPEPVLYYRQHGDSEMGRNDTARAMALRLGRLFQGNYGGWLRSNHAALDGARALLTPANRAILDRFGEALDMPGPLAARALYRLGLYRHTCPGTSAFYAAAALGRLRRADRSGAADRRK
ncbi:glycosyltransferase [Paracoccus sp. (in: a-proteobacteria)]|uniref:glycosyltransferase n=1 Tax=Paracoccus sp. TaxID=267 RepID=UPI003A8562DE